MGNASGPLLLAPAQFVQPPEQGAGENARASQTEGQVFSGDVWRIVDRLSEECLKVMSDATGVKARLLELHTKQEGALLQIRELGTSLENAEQLTRDLKNEIVNLKTVLNETHTSRSWRLTRPLRRFSSGTR